MSFGHWYLDQWWGTVAGPLRSPPASAGASSAGATAAGRGLGAAGMPSMASACTRIRDSAAEPHRIPIALTGNLLDGPETVPKSGASRRKIGRRLAGKESTRQQFFQSL